MKHKLINYLLIAGALVFSASCAEEGWRGNGASGGDPIEIGEITVNETPQSRAHDNSDNWIWVPNEKIVVTATGKDNKPLGQATYRRNMTNDAWISDSPLQASVKQDGTVFTVSTVMPSATEKNAQNDAYNYVLTDYVMATDDEVSFTTDGKLTAKLKHRTVDVVAVLTKGDGWESDEAFYEALSTCSATFYAGSTYTVKGFAVSGNDDSVDYNDNAGDNSIAPGKKTYIFRAHLDDTQLAAANSDATPLLQLTGLYSNDRTGEYTRPDGVANGKRLTVTFSVDAPEVDITRSATSGDSSLKSGVAVVQDWLGKRALYGTDNVWDGSIKQPAYDKQTKTYTITTGAELAWLVDNQITKEQTAKLANDINLGEGLWTKGIGDWDDQSFQGTFDGGGNVITLTNATASLFFVIGNKGTVQNLGVTGTVTASSSAGGIATNNSGTIQNCFTSVNVTSTADADTDAGGIAGYNSGTIQNCYTTGAITGTGNAGGIAGSNGSAGAPPTLSACYATGTITGNTAGGIVGRNGMGGQTEKCIALNTGGISGSGTAPEVGRIAANNELGTLTKNHASPGIPGTWNNIGDGKLDGADLTADNFTNVRNASEAFTDWTTGEKDWDLTTANLPTLKGFTANQPVKDITRAKAMSKPLITSIATEDDLKEFRDAVKGGGDYTGKNVTLKASFSVSDWKEGIGTFKGTFDGDGHVITLTGPTSLFNQIGEYGSTAGTVQNLGVKATIKGTANGKSIGAIAEANYGTIRQCYAEGSITSEQLASYAGGIVGTNKGTVQDCYSTVAITVKQGAGGIVQVNRDGGIVQRCYATGAITGGGDYIGGITGNNTGGSKITQCIALNASITDATGNASLGRITGTNSSTLTTNYASPLIAGKWNNIAAGKIDGDELTDDNFINKPTGTTAFDGWQAAVWDFTDEAKLPILKNFKVTQPASAITRADFLEKLTIDNADELMKFRDAVNGGKTYEGKTVKLTAPITVNAWATGIDGFKGTFNGDGYLITMTNATASLFETINKGGTVQNLGVNATINASVKVGGIAATNKGTIQRCYTEGTITSSQTYSSGIADNEGTIEDCYSTASVTVTGGGYYAGGIAGGNFNGTILRCYATGAISSRGNAGIAGMGINPNSVQNCIALNSSITKTGAQARIANGSATLTNNYASALIAGTWNNIGANLKDGADLDDSNFTGTGAGQGAFTNWSETVWDFGDTTKLPILQDFKGTQSVKDSTRADFLEKPITIATADELKKFSEAVNNGKTYNGKTVTLTADITLTGNWTPIGNSTNTFAGTFEGGDHCISGLSININLAGIRYGGLFGYIASEGIVQNLGVKGKVSVTSTNNTACAGGITGSNNGTIQNCYTDVTVTSSTGDTKNSFDCAGGIAGMNNNKISNCYTRGNSTAVMLAGGIAGRNTVTIGQCYATGAVKATHTVIGSAGGIVGYSSSRSQRCIALNSSITGAFSGRIAGNDEDGTFTDNYASPAIPGTWQNNTADGIDGATLTWTNYKSATNGWSSASWNSVGNSAKLPTLKGFGTRQPAALLRWVSFLP